jgi:hypothetical protein
MRVISMLSLAAIGLLVVAGRPQPRSASETAANDLAGEWRAQLQFTSGPSPRSRTSSSCTPSTRAGP